MALEKSGIGRSRLMFDRLVPSAPVPCRKYECVFVRGLEFPEDRMPGRKREMSGFKVGRQAPTIAPLTSTTDQIAIEKLSYVGSVVVAPLCSE